MHRIHLISHTHWDREWYQTFQQFRIRLVHLVDGLLDILDSDSQYLHFMLDGQTIVLEDYLQIRPEREGDLRRYIQNGRVLIGPWYILPDEFLVSPEATIRNLLEGDRVAKKFGPKMMVGYIPDPFGHIGQMPQILRGFGIQTASLWRGVEDQPNEFWWQSPDGSRVLMGFLLQGYGNAAGILGKNLDGFVESVRGIRDQLAENSSGQDLLLMHGVDHQEANPDTAAAVAFSENRLDGDVLIHSTLPDYFAGVMASLDLERLPVVTGELRSPKKAPMLPGVLSTRMWIKQRNRACETLLEKWAEPFSVWADLYAGSIHPEGSLCSVSRDAVLRQAWRLLMQCHPHDSICGCSIDAVHDEMRPRFDQVEQMGEEITRQSLARLVETVETRFPSTLAAGSVYAAITVFNPAAGPRSDAVSLRIEASADGGEFELVDETGTSVPFQTQGMGNGEFMRMKMERKEFLGIVGMATPGMSVGDGRILGMVARRDGDEAHIEIQLGQWGEPDLAAWEVGRAQIEALLKDATVVTYIISGRSNAACQVLFSARDVPGYGYRTFWVRGKPNQPKAAVQISPLMRSLMPLATRLMAIPAAQKLGQRLQPDPASKPPYTIENEFFLVEAQADGTLDVRDRSSGACYRGQNRLVDGGDRGDEYNYSAPEKERLVTAKLKGVRVERGTVQQTLTIGLELEVPAGLAADRKTRGAKTITLPVTSRVTLTVGVARMDIHTEIDNRASDHRLRAHFPVPFAANMADYDGHLEIVRRPVGVPAFDSTWIEQPRPEVPQRAFTLVESGENGLLVANRGLPEVEVVRRDDGTAEIAVTLLRCVGWISRDDFPERKGHAGPGTATPGAQLLGKWGFDLALVPFQMANRLQAIQQGYAFETKLRAVGCGLHAGTLPPQGAFVQVDADKFVISAVKTAEDGRGFVVRGYNLGDSEAAVSLNLARDVSSADRVNLAEEKQESLLLAQKRAVTLDVKGHEIASVRFKTEE